MTESAVTASIFSRFSIQSLLSPSRITVAPTKLLLPSKYVWCTPASAAVTPVNASEELADPAHKDGSAGKSRRPTLISDINYINRLTQEILEMAPADPDPETVKSIKLAGSQLNAVHISLTGNGPQLPDKEQIAPNQLSWPPTAACMGVKRGEKRRGKVDSALTAEHISVPKRKRPNDDPYGAGEDSGKRAKPDAVSAAANARARAAEERKAFAKAEAAECPPPPASLPTHLSPHPAYPTHPAHPTAYVLPHPMHMPAMYSLAHFPVPQLPYSQPTYMFHYPSSQPARSPYPPMFSPHTFPPPT